MTLAIQALDASFQRILPLKDDFAEAFYAELFRRFPETKALFEQRHTDIQRQRKALMQALETVLDALKEGQTEQLCATLTQLGQQHRQYGVQPEDYAKVGAVLLDTLADYDPDWSEQLNTEWMQAYGAVVGMMESATTTA
jgi:hemoglobin-like flavoprotein